LPEKIGARKSEKSLSLKGAFLEKIQKFKIFFFLSFRENKRRRRRRYG